MEHSEDRNGSESGVSASGLSLKMHTIVVSMFAFEARTGVDPIVEDALAHRGDTHVTCSDDNDKWIVFIKHTTPDGKVMKYLFRDGVLSSETSEVS